MRFTKYSGSGNDFAIIDNRAGDYSSFQKRDTIQMLCDRHYGIGADGIIFLEMAGRDYRMRIFQPDGLEVEMCGNGLRCLGHYIYTLDPTTKSFPVVTMETVVTLLVDSDNITIEMPQPHSFSEGQATIDDKEIPFFFVNTGVPHAIVFVDNIDHPDFIETARKLRHHPMFSPGPNVSYVKKTSPNSLEIRTYERGVEGETHACGTGATAAALLAGRHKGCTSPITLTTKSQDQLVITFPSPITLQGKVHPLFQGSWLGTSKNDKNTH